MLKNQKIQVLMIIILSMVTVAPATAQKKTQKFRVSFEIPHSAEKVWSVVGVDYGAVANSHPKIVASNYINGSLKAKEGAQRVCYFNDKQTKFLHEKIVNYNPDEMTFVNQVFQAGRFPVDPDYTRGTYKIVPIDANNSRFIFDMEYRTKPAFMGALAKGKFKKLIKDYAIAIEHHLTTGESVTKENFRDVKKQHKARISR